MDRTGRHFLVERFVPSARHADIAAAVGRLAESTDGVVEHLQTVLIEEEEICLSLFRAPDRLGVASVNARADFPFHRIVEVRLVEPEEGRADRARAGAGPSSRVSRDGTTERPPAVDGAR